MKDTIYRQDAIDTFLTDGSVFVYGADVCKAIVSRIKQLPSAEPEIIRCKDCRHNGSFDTDCPIKWNKTDSDYCSWAER